LPPSLPGTPSLEGVPLETPNNLPAALQISRGGKLRTLHVWMVWWMVAGLVLFFS
jgi:hypothetical protein